jgi:hypothetical protein
MILRISLLIVLSEAVSTDASAVLFNILDAGDPHRFKVTREGAGMGLEFQDTF